MWLTTWTANASSTDLRIENRTILWKTAAAVNRVTMRPDGWSTDIIANDSKARLLGTTTTSIVTGIS
jgi:hypothetical protein